MQTVTQLVLSQAVLALDEASKRVFQDTNEMVGSGELIPLIRHFAELREVNETIKKARKLIEDLEDHMSHFDVPDAFKRNSIKTVNVMDIGRVTVAYKWGCSIVDGKKPEGLEWLRESGNGGIIIQTVNAQTLASFAKNEVETHGRELPTDLFSTKLTPYTSITKV
jgi:hypothetical protein